MPGGRVSPLAGDASTREFFRVVVSPNSTAVVMDYGAPFDGESDDIRLERLFRSAGLPVARVLAVGNRVGALLLDDLGERSLEQALNEATPTTGRQLLEDAVRLAARIVTAGTPVLAESDRADGPVLDVDRFRFEMDFFVNWYLTRHEGRASVPHDLISALYELAALAADSPLKVLCHRDFHSRNLILRADGSLAMVDIQDARWGPDTYDLASLLYDAYIEVPDDWRPPLVDLWAHRTRADAAFHRRLDWVAAQRMLKALGTFGYQIEQRGRETYLPAIERTLRRLKQLLPRLDLPPRLARGLAEVGILD